MAFIGVLIMDNRKGFSLIELLVVIMIWSILAIIAIVRVPNVKTLQSQDVADSLLFDLSLTRIIAMSTNQPYKIVVSTNSYQITDVAGNPITHPQTLTQAFNYPAGTTISPSATLQFDSMGTPYDGAGNALSSAFSWVVTTSSASRTITVSAETGFVQ